MFFDGKMMHDFVTLLYYDGGRGETPLVHRSVTKSWWLRCHWDGRKDRRLKLFAVFKKKESELEKDIYFPRILF